MRPSTSNCSREADTYCGLSCVRIGIQAYADCTYNIDGNRGRGSDGESVSCCDFDREGSLSGVRVGFGASAARGTIAKVPATRGHTNAVGGRGGEGEALSNYRVRRTGANSHCRLVPDRYGYATW